MEIQVSHTKHAVCMAIVLLLENSRGSQGRRAISGSKASTMVVHAGKRTETLLPHLAGESDALEKHRRSTCVHCCMSASALLIAPMKHRRRHLVKQLVCSPTGGGQADEVEYFESQCPDKDVGDPCK
ncbi:hypothetical protein GW17_00027410 [Ensete ventricosum]|nr:hypothetical protein GW17_00027410 [Ensete ventricosum]